MIELALVRSLIRKRGVGLPYPFSCLFVGIPKVLKRKTRFISFLSSVWCAWEWISSVSELYDEMCLGMKGEIKPRWVLQNHKTKICYRIAWLLCYLGGQFNTDRIH
jgi:hypothetical protein